MGTESVQVHVCVHMCASVCWGDSVASVGLPSALRCSCARSTSIACSELNSQWLITQLLAIWGATGSKRLFCKFSSKNLSGRLLFSRAPPGRGGKARTAAPVSLTLSRVKPSPRCASLHTPDGEWELCWLLKVAQESDPGLHERLLRHLDWA